MQSDLIVIGGGHAGCEAALAAARLGVKTTLITMSPDTIAAMSCNPAIGGPAAKSHLVRELDALGGQMARVIDCSYLNIRHLNESRGPAVAALRAQADKKVYQTNMILQLERQENLAVKQGLVTDLLVNDGKAVGVILKSGLQIDTQAVILATGTFLGGQIVMGNIKYSGGRQGEPAAPELSDNLKRHGLKLRRFQTATPPRIHRRSINFQSLNPQPLTEKEWGFSWDGLGGPRQEYPCWVSQTTPETIRVIQENLKYSPIQSGAVTGKGPKFCPSIDRKVLRFPAKTDHQIFLEPESQFTEEVYLLGLTTAMPEWIQESILKTIPGLENVEIIRPGYAVEYDCLDSFQFYSSLESKVISGLFTAGQINGTSGYEEAAVQGLIAGINAARKILGLNSYVPTRTHSYIGVLIDDLVTRGTEEPYRMMTSLAEFRLFLRLDNALERLGSQGFQLGLISESQRQNRVRLLKQSQELAALLKDCYLSPTSALRHSYSLPDHRIRLHDLILRPEISKDDFYGEFPELNQFPEPVKDYVWNEIRLKGYLDRQAQQRDAMVCQDHITISGDFDFQGIPNLSPHGLELLRKINPVSLGQALRIQDLSYEDQYILSLYFHDSAKTDGWIHDKAI